MTCSCRSTSELCDPCRDALWMQLRGVAACRGDTWADQLARRRRGPWTPWPVESQRVRDVARGWVEDLTRDERLRKMLVDVVIAYAAKRWNDQRPAASASA